MTTTTIFGTGLPDILPSGTPPMPPFIAFGYESGDTITGSNGNDTVYAGQGSDVVAGGKGEDLIYGGQGNDSINGGNASDLIYGDDETGSMSGDDSIEGGGGNDTIIGGQGIDIISGGDGNDSLSGNQGSDSIDGGNGNDTIGGGKDSDTITGGAGVDVLLGGDGVDTFILNTNDFAAGEKIDGGNDYDFLQAKGNNNLSTGSLSSIEEIQIAEGVTLIMDQENLIGVQKITGAGTLKAATGTLNLNGIQVTTEVQDSDGNVVQPGSDGGGFPGKTFVLTTQPEFVEGTPDNDTIFGVIEGATTTTFQTSDVIDGKGGFDALNLTTNGAAVGGPVPVVTSVEQFDITSLGVVANTVAATRWTGVEVIQSVLSSKDLTVNEIQNGVTLGLVQTNQDFKAVFKDGALGSGAATLNINTNDVSKDAGITPTLTFDVGGSDKVTELDLAATGNSFIKIAAGAAADADLKVVKASGSGKVDVTFDVATVPTTNVTTVDATPMTTGSGLTIDLSGNTKDIKITGGQGDDSFKLGMFGATDTVDGGAGKDTLGIGSVDANTVSIGTATLNVSNVEILEITDAVAAATQINVDKFGSALNNVKFDEDITGATKVLNLTSGATIDVVKNAPGDLTLDVKGAGASTSDVLNLNLSGTAAQTLAKVSAQLVETLNVDTTVSDTGTKAAAQNTITTLDGPALTTITVKGNEGLTVTANNALGLTSLDASALDGDLTFTAAAGATAALQFKSAAGIDTYIGVTTKSNTIYGSKGMDAFTLNTPGGPQDTLIYTAANQSNATDGIDTLTNFDTAADLIRFAESLKTGTPTFIGTAAFSSSGNTQLRLMGADLQVDLDGNGSLDMQINGVGATFGAANFAFNFT